MTRKLARLCEHDQIKPHPFVNTDDEWASCPGGEFLPEGALGVNGIIAEVDRLETIVGQLPHQPATHRQVIAAVILDFQERGLLASQVGESER